MFIEKYGKYLLLLPGLIIIVFFLILPLILIVIVSFMQIFTFREPTLTLQNYIDFVASPQTPTILLNTFGMSIGTALLTLLAGYPAAYVLAFKIESIKIRNYIISLLLVPFFIDWNARTIAWIPILGESGAVNYMLQALNIVREPVQLLFSRWTLLIIWLQTNILFAIFPIYLALIRIDPDLINAARVLKAPPHRVFYNIIFKLSLPGVVVGFTFVFVNTLGDYITPALWAGGIQVLGLSISSFAANFVWPYAATQSTILILIALAVLFVLFKIVDIKKLVE
ncbi:Putrescine transport system permease protein PotH [archaeon HR01]|nr:Putrescine transport system permease protein PotH [archaeon HR01]